MPGTYQGRTRDTLSVFACHRHHSGHLRSSRYHSSKNHGRSGTETLGALSTLAAESGASNQRFVRRWEADCGTYNSENDSAPLLARCDLRCRKRHEDLGDTRLSRQNAIAFTGTQKKFVVVLEPGKPTEEERKHLLEEEAKASIAIQ